MNWLWTTEAMVEAMEGRPFGDLPDGVSGLSIDTRTLQKGEAFFAIKGEKFDGHNFATAAMAAGAGLMVVSEAKLPALGRLKIGMIVVDDVLVALGRLSRAARARVRGQVIAVTGSAGKTTTKEMLRAALAPSGLVHASSKSFNNHWGVPLSLARMPETTAFGIFEIGMNHAGEITPLVDMVKPHIGIVTMIGAAHLGHFKNLDEIAHAKAEIFSGIVPGGYALINRDDGKYRLLEKLAHEAGAEHVLSFGEHAKADYRLAECHLDASGSDFKARIGAEMVKGRIGAPGRHLVQNALAVLAAAHLAGADLGHAARALGAIEAEEGRGRRHLLAHPEGGHITLIDESYNANPASVRAALSVLAATPVDNAGRRIAVLGDMLELGKHSAKQHAELAAPLLEADLHHLYLAGTEMAALRDALPDGYPASHFQSVEDLCRTLLETLKGGDVIMLKSSNGIGFKRIVDAILETHPEAAPPASSTDTGGD